MRAVSGGAEQQVTDFVRDDTPEQGDLVDRRCAGHFLHTIGKYGGEDAGGRFHVHERPSELRFAQ